MLKTSLFIFANFLMLNAFAIENDSIVKPQIRSSAIAIANLKTTQNHYIKCTYGQPLKKGRQVFGGLVPYDKLWRTGANEATEITFTSNFKIGDTSLPAGTYTLFTIPSKDNWTIILNSVLGQWGDFTYDAAKDVLRFETTSAKNENIYEGFTIEFEEKKSIINLKLLWDNTVVIIPIELIGEINHSKLKKKRKKK